VFDIDDTPRNGGDPVALASLRLVAAMVERAERDAQRGDQGAAAWLAWLRGGLRGSGGRGAPGDPITKKQTLQKREQLGNAAD